MISRSAGRPTALPDQIDALRAAVELADGRLDPDAVAFARTVTEKAEGRLKHGATHTLVALLGATGTGKSSLTNVIVGTDVAEVGVRRPTTSSTLACVWGDAETARHADPLLDWLEVDRRHHVGSHEHLSGLVLLDVPDHDSVRVAHRLEMERVAELCDLMVWVTDPEKYADAALHHYLRTLDAHDPVIVIVLNKADLLDPASLEACRADLVRLATGDGIGHPTVLTVSAATGAGVDQLIELVTGIVRRNEAMVARLSADITTAGQELMNAGGGTEGATVTDRAVRRLATDLVDATGVDPVVEAVASGTRRDAAAVMGWPFTRWVRRLRPHPLRRHHLGAGSTGRTSLPTATPAQSLRAASAIRSFVDEVSADLADPWPLLLRDAGTPDGTELQDRLDQAVASGVRAHAGRTPRWWSVIGAVQVGLAVATAIGAAWLTVLLALAWLQVPDPPTPDWRGWPVPTLLALGGATAGLLLATIARRAAGVSARRAASRVRTAVTREVETVAAELVAGPVRDELADRDRLIDQLRRAGA